MIQNCLKKFNINILIYLYFNYNILIMNDYISDDKLIEYIRIDQYYHRGDEPIQSFLDQLRINKFPIKTDAYPRYQDSLLCKFIFEGSDFIDVVYNLIFEKQVFIGYMPSQEDIDYINNINFIEHTKKYYFYRELTLRCPLLDVLIAYNTGLLYDDSRKKKWIEIINFLVDSNAYCNKKIISFLEYELENLKKYNKENELFDKDIHYYTDIITKLKTSYSFV